MKPAGVPFAVRTVVLTAALIPFLIYATKDQILHLRARRVSLWENLVHLGLGVVLAAAIASAYAGRSGTVVAASLFFVALGGIDEYVFHRALPAIESDTHAKEHLAFLIFLVAFATLEWVGAGRPLLGERGL